MILKRVFLILSAAVMLLSCFSQMRLVYAIDDSKEKNFLTIINQTGSDYGYRDLENRSNPEGRKQFYNDLMDNMKNFSISENDVEVLPNIYIGDIYMTGAFILENYGLTFSEANEVYEIFRADNPIFYFASNVFYAFPIENQTYIITATYNEFSEASTKMDYNKAIIDYIESYSSCVKGVSKYEDAKAIHDKLILSMTYAYEEDGVTPLDSTKSTCVIGAVEGSGISMSYAKTYQMLCNYYGIENIYVRGKSNTWNIIKLEDGRYYNVDVAMDDTGDEIIYDSYNYFAVGSRTFNQNHIVKTPEGEGTDFQYALPEVSEIRFCSVEFNSLYRRTCSDYGYLDMDYRSNSEGRKKFYNDILDDMIRLWNDTDIDFDPIQTDMGVLHMRNMYTIESYGITKSEATEVYYTFRQDNPLLYYVSNQFFTLGTDDMTLYFSTVFEEFAEGSIRKKYNSMIFDYIESYSSCIDRESVFRSAKAIHDKLIMSMDYAYEEDGITPMDNGKVHSIIGAIEGLGTCEAYAKTYQMLCNYYGIENVYVQGVTGISGLITGRGHAWNIIKLDDGLYYNVDCTGDDYLNVIKYDYFAQGSSTFDITHVAYTPDYEGVNFQYALPEISQFSYKSAIKGDVNNDGVFNVTDVVILQKWLLNIDSTKFVNWKNGDLCEDNIIDIFDLYLMKKLILDINYKL